MKIPILKYKFKVYLTCTICYLHIVAIFTKNLTNQREIMQEKLIFVILPHNMNWSSDKKIKHTLKPLCLTDWMVELTSIYWSDLTVKQLNHG